jgi:hypothetical protein
MCQQVFTRERSSKGLLFTLLLLFFFFFLLLFFVVLVVRIDVSQIKAFLVNLTPPSITLSRSQQKLRHSQQKLRNSQ